MAEHKTDSANKNQPDPGKTPSHPQTDEQKGAGPINDPGSGVAKEDGSKGADNMGRA
jgi:hypothetical protein